MQIIDLCEEGWGDLWESKFGSGVVKFEILVTIWLKRYTL